MLADARIVYLFVYVSDLANARRFYEGALDLRVLEADGESVKYDCGSVILALNVAGRYGIELTRERDSSTDIVWLVDDLDAVRDTLAARGVRFNQPVEYEVGIIVDFYDPDQHWLSLYQPSEEALGWPSGARIAAVREARAGGGGGGGGAVASPPRTGTTLRDAELIYAFFFVPDADDAEAFYRDTLGLRDIEGGPCSQGSNGDEEGVIKYDTGGLMLTTHFYDQTLPPLAPDEHGCPPRILELDRMKGVAPAFAVEGVRDVVVGVRERRPGFARVADGPLGVIATCDDPGGHRLFLWEPSEQGLAGAAGEKVRQILATPL